MKRIATAAVIALLTAWPAAAADVAGNWTIAANIAGMDVPLTCTFTQDGEKLGGKCQGPGAPADGLAVTGETKGSKATFTYTVSVQGMDLTLTYNADIDSPTTMKGEINMMGQNSGSFTGKKG